MPKEEKEQLWNNELENGKCKVCGACGIDPCCPPSDCNMTGNNRHCKYYLEQLNKSYIFYQKIYGLMYENQKEYPELWCDMQEIFTDIFLTIDI